MESGDLIERRVFPRFPAEVAVQVQAVGEAAATERINNHRYVSRDVSRTGMRLWGNQNLPVNATLLLTFECQQFGWQNVISRLGAVVWAEELSTAGVYLIGVRFVEDMLPEIADAQAVGDD